MVRPPGGSLPSRPSSTAEPVGSGEERMTPRMHAAYISFAAGVVENVWRQPATLLRIITITARQRGKRVAADGDVLELPRGKMMAGPREGSKRLMFRAESVKR